MTNLQRLTLERLADFFGVDTTAAQGLDGSALDAWIEAAEDDVFQKEHAALVDGWAQWVARGSQSKG